VWPLIAEARRWQEWSFLDRTELEREGSPNPDGVGALRRFTRHGIGSREEVVAWEPPRHLGYSIVSGFPVRNYRADVVLEPDGTGTTISWSVRFDGPLPGTGPMIGAVLRGIVTRFATGVARYAEQATG
jgi:polyketide cyclase/dehydrase/lipid transport protein